MRLSRPRRPVKGTERLRRERWHEAGSVTVQTVTDGLGGAFEMAWEILAGADPRFALSGIVQARVTRGQMGAVQDRGSSQSRTRRAYTLSPTVIVFVVTGEVPPILLVSLLILVYLTVSDLWPEGVPLLVKAWWVLLVLLLNLLGYVALRIWLAVRRRGA